MHKKVLVAGGAGFIGSHLCEALLKREYHVVCVDNLTTGSKENIAQLFTHPQFEFIEHDITAPLELRVDEIYNLACPASPLQYQKDPVATLKTNVLGMMHLLELAKGCKAFILQASTSEVYGDPEVHPQKESYWGHVNPIGIRACYDEGKRCAETLCFDYKRQYGVAVKVARIFNTYGPKMALNDGRVITNFIRQAKENKPITLFGNGSQTRSFCYVDDLVEGLLAFMQAPAQISGPINLGNPEEWNMLDVALFVKKRLNSTSEIVFSPLPQDDPKKRRPDIELAGQLLNWKPSYSLQEGLEKTLAHLDEKNSLAPIQGVDPS